MAENFASAMHQSDNPLNLANLLNTGLNIATQRLAPAVVPAPTQNVNTTPGANAPTPSPQVGEPTTAERLKQYVPIVIVVAVLIGFLAWALRKG